MAVTLESIKDEYAKEEWPDNWEAMSRAMDFLVMNEIAKRYAEACCKATLEKAAENVEMGSFARCQSSVLNPSNIVLL